MNENGLKIYSDPQIQDKLNEYFYVNMLDNVVEQTNQGKEHNNHRLLLS